MAGELFSNVDTAWLRMEDPTNLMMITGVMVFSAPIEFERLKATLEHRLLRFDRFRQRVVPPRVPLGRYRWKDDAAFDISDHLHRLTLPRPRDQAALQDVASELMSTPLDLSRPLWEIHLIEDYGDGCAVIARLHHCIADGIALVRVLLSLTDAVPDAPWPVPAKPTAEREKGPLDVLFRPVRSALNTTNRITETLIQESQQIIENPSRVSDLAQLGTSSATALARLTLRWPDPKTLFKGELGVAKRAAWSNPIPLGDVKAVGRAVGGTVNDVLLTAVTGALRRYMQSRDDPVDGLNVRAVVPVNLRPPDEELSLGNRFGLVFLSLPVGVADAMARLHELKRRMDALKDTPEAMIAFGILNAIGMAPSQIQDIVVNIFGTKGTAVMTNVPGPKETIYLAGAPLKTIMFWVPRSGRLGLGVSILSYAGNVWLGVATDQGLVPDPESIIASFHTEFDELAKLTLQMEAAQAQDTSAITAGSIEAMTAMINEAIQKVSVLIEEAKSAAPPDRCRALTKAGRTCKNYALPGSDFCRVHQGQANSEEA